MGKIQDLTGQKFTRWFVIERGENRFYPDGKKYKITWKCVCDCGTKREVIGAYLTGEYSKSCGCLTIVKSKKQPGEENFNTIYYNYFYRSKKLNRVFELTKEQFKIITSLNCYYCGTEPTTRSKTQPNMNGYYIYNGVDRRDNNIGYTLKNSVACCSICNYAKHTLTIEEFKKWVIRISFNLPNFLKKEREYETN